jgi:hypothetical protein
LSAGDSINAPAKGIYIRNAQPQKHEGVLTTKTSPLIRLIDNINEDRKKEQSKNKTHKLSNLGRVVCRLLRRWDVVVVA